MRFGLELVARGGGAGGGGGGGGGGGDGGGKGVGPEGITVDDPFVEAWEFVVLRDTSASSSSSLSGNSDGDASASSLMHTARGAAFELGAPTQV